MWRTWLLLAALMLARSPCNAADLLDIETRWLKAAWPVIQFAKAEGLPLDIVVQPQDSPGAAPLALGFVDGRCKLVLSMRGNAQAQATLDRLSPELLAPTLELMAAHELGHCRRYLDGAWYDLPKGFAPAVPEGLSSDLRAAYLDMRASRREEAYGDLVGLAWTAQHHPELYVRLHAWLVEERSADVVPGSPHDTMPWVGLAADGSAMATGSPFTAAAPLWRAGLRLED